MRELLLLLSLAAVPASAAAQSVPPVPPKAPAPSNGAASTGADMQSPDAYTYKADGRRDPFLSLISSGTEPRAVGKRADGAAGFNVNEISVRGIMQTKSALVAMIQGPDNKTYVIHQGDKLADGVVKTVTIQGLVVLQNVSDPLSTQKQREVRKLLRSLEDAK